jgi:hypothetical protein
MDRQYKFWTAWNVTMRPISGPETSEQNYNFALRIILKEHISQLHRSASPNSRQLFSFTVLTCLVFSLVYFRHSSEMSTYHIKWRITKILGRNPKFRPKNLSKFPSLLRSNTIISLYLCTFWKWPFQLNLWNKNLQAAFVPSVTIYVQHIRHSLALLPWITYLLTYLFTYLLTPWS